MGEHNEPKTDADGTPGKLDEAAQDAGDPVLMGDGLSVDHLTALEVSTAVIAALKKNDIKTYGDFRKWSEKQINETMRAMGPIRGLAASGRKLIGSGDLKRAHDELNKTMQELNEKKKADAERRRGLSEYRRFELRRTRSRSQR